MQNFLRSYLLIWVQIPATPKPFSLFPKKRKAFYGLKRKRKKLLKKKRVDDIMKYGIIGCGHLGSAILDNLINSGIGKTDIYISDKNCSLTDLAKKTINVSRNNYDVAKNCDVLILAVQPKDMENVLKEIKEVCNLKKIIVTVAAGLETNFYDSKITAKVIRVMPNLALTVGEMAGAYCFGKNAARKDIEVLGILFGKNAKLIEISEDKMHVVTALSGCGPAFVAYFIGKFAKAAKEQGLDEKQALLLAEQTFYGASKLMIQQKVLPESFIERVATKGGITETALKVMDEADVEKIINETIKAAVNKSKEVSSLNK
ncbi:MAG: pyrroline-5-carboxylate reductase [Candidatus Diapherotrites archaeon CG08_land_8_20_14_0_20_34_12]|nr:MAG: pyrroline-5-carboxylate reductase [Candidatus Diapherotrites archaeon CG08_land_8_20_14_0_20_34_12]